MDVVIRFHSGYNKVNTTRLFAGKGRLCLMKFPSRIFRAGRTLAMAGVLDAAQAAAETAKKARDRLACKKEETITMKKSTFAAILVFLAAVAGALAAAYMYIQRREKELDEYEQLLFSEEFNQEVPEEEKEEVVPAPAAEEEQPAEKPAETPAE